MFKKKKRKTHHFSLFLLGLDVAGIVLLLWIFYIAQEFEPAWTYSWGGFRPEVRDEALAITKHNLYLDPRRIYTCSRTASTYRREQERREEAEHFKKMATYWELERLLHHPDAYLRILAFEGLAAIDPNSIPSSMETISREKYWAFSHTDGRIKLARYLLNNYFEFRKRTHLLRPDPPLGLKIIFSRSK
ncbi:MAG: hypothetical protein R2824_27390 [Saprospiraceae bacterium]